MTTQNADVRTTITLRGEDQASSAINGAKKAIEDAGNAALAADAKSKALGETAKKVSPVLGGLGSLAASQFGAAGQAAGLLGATLDLLPGKVGLIAAAAIAAAGGLVALYRQAEQAANARVNAEIAYRESLKGNAEQLAEMHGALSLAADLARERIRVEGTLQAKLEEARQVEIQALKARRDGEIAVASAAEGRLGTLRLEIADLDVINAKLRERRQIEDAFAGAATRIKADRQEQIKDAEIAIAQMAEGQQRQNAEQGLIRAKLAVEREHIAALQESRKIVAARGGDVAALDRQEREARREVMRLEGEAFAAHEAFEAKKRADRQRGHAEAMRQMAERQRKAEEMRQGELRVESELMATLRAQADALAASELRLAQARAAAATSNADDQARLEILAIELERTQQIEAAKRRLAEGSVELANVIATADISARTRIAAAEQRADAARKARTDQDVAAQRAREDGYVSMAKSGVEALAAIGVGERALAGIKAGIATAEGLLAFARGDYVGAAAGAAAAVAFGAQALGVGASAAPVQPSAIASAPAPRADIGGGQGGGGGPITIVLQGGAVVGSEQGVGKAVRAALESLAGTGLQSKAVGV